MMCIYYFNVKNQQWPGGWEELEFTTKWQTLKVRSMRHSVRTRMDEIPVNTLLQGQTSHAVLPQSGFRCKAVNPQNFLTACSIDLSSTVAWWTAKLERIENSCFKLLSVLLKKPPAVNNKRGPKPCCTPKNRKQQTLSAFFFRVWGLGAEGQQISEASPRSPHDRSVGLMEWISSLCPASIILYRTVQRMWHIFNRTDSGNFTPVHIGLAATADDVHVSLTCLTQKVTLIWGVSGFYHRKTNPVYDLPKWQDNRMLFVARPHTFVCNRPPVCFCFRIPTTREIARACKKAAGCYFTNTCTSEITSCFETYEGHSWIRVERWQELALTSQKGASSTHSKSRTCGSAESKISSNCGVLFCSILVFLDKKHGPSGTKPSCHRCENPFSVTCSVALVILAVRVESFYTGWSTQWSSIPRKETRTELFEDRCKKKKPFWLNFKNHSSDLPQQWRHGSLSAETYESPSASQRFNNTSTCSHCTTWTLLLISLSLPVCFQLCRKPRLCLYNSSYPSNYAIWHFPRIKQFMLVSMLQGLPARITLLFGRLLGYLHFMGTILTFVFLKSFCNKRYRCQSRSE